MAHKDVLIVDGYNIIGVWSGCRYLKNKEREHAKTELIHLLADYQGYSGLEVIVVFDAYSIPGEGRQEVVNKLAVHYSSYQQTADQYIESLVGEIVAQGRIVHVATADHLEQTITFAKGAYRMTARELWGKLQLEKSDSAKHKSENRMKTSSSTIGDRMDAQQKALFEQWRREKG
jgi:predicted RNA-binding protein with PIN domain